MYSRLGKASGGIAVFMVASIRSAERLKAKVEERAVRQYVCFLAGQAEVRGVDLNAAPTPLVQ